ncbi:amidohydrolase family protein [Microbacterium resistens]|uniref:amidohydrolase family protein n=1 Tax=Microbacterium resistens TaxID=156977 RepID=UPI00366C4DD6
MGSAGAPQPATDVHTHLAPLLDAAAQRESGVATDDDGRLVLDGRAIGPDALYSPDRLLRYLDEHALDAAFVSVPPPFFRQDLPAERTEEWVEAVNDGILAACATDDRLKPLAYLPLENPAAAARTVRTHLATDGFVGWVGAAGGRSVALDSPELAEAWHLLAADGRPVLLHPAESPDERLAAHYLHNLLGNPVETGVATAELVLGGVLAANPHLRIVLVHCGGVVPSVAARWQRGLDTARPGLDASSPPVATMLHDLYADCLTHDGANVDLARHVFGDDRLLLGSDWPFPMGLEDPREPIAHLDPTLQDRIARINPSRLTSAHHPLSLGIR